MICKDTVEDKILSLQGKKRLFAADLITDDTGFVKSLTKEDIEYLLVNLFLFLPGILLSISCVALCTFFINVQQKNKAYKSATQRMLNIYSSAG